MKWYSVCMERVGTFAELISRHQDGVYFTSRHHLFWHAPGDLGGFAVWGRPQAEEAIEFVNGLLQVLARPDEHPRAMIADMSRLEHIDVDVFLTLKRHVDNNHAAIQAVNMRKAIVRPGGLLGAAVAGFLYTTRRNSDFTLVTEVGEALSWLDREEQMPFVLEMGKVTDLAAQDSGVIDGLRRALLADCAVSLDDVARSLHMSPRNLQRHLRLAGTSFRDERDTARLVLAKQAIAARTSKVSALAHDLGFATPDYFSAWFKRRTGATPQEWRRRERP